MICIECGHHNELSALACEQCAAALRESTTQSDSGSGESRDFGSQGGEAETVLSRVRAGAEGARPDDSETQGREPARTQPGQPARTQPGQPARTQPGQPARTQPGQPARTQPGQPARTQPAEMRPGDRLGPEEPGGSGRYEIMRELGRGGMGVVYLARDRRFTDALGGLDRRVVIKRILDADEPSVARFLRETRAIAVLEHENIVHIHDFGEDLGGPYIVMGYVEGGTLKQAIREDGPLSDDAFYEIARGLGRALDYVHEHHILHRDVKPSNVILTRDGLPKLSDFGLVRFGADSELSATGYGMGTADYAAPEQRRGDRHVDQRADLYSLGATLYFAVTGEVPKTIRESRLPERWRGLVLRCVEDRPEDRFEDAKAFLEALEVARDDSQSSKGASDPLDGTRCGNCSAINRVGENYCRQCGAGMYRSCPSCREMGEASAGFCGSCGLDIDAWVRSEEHLRSAQEHLEAGAFEEAVYEGRRAEDNFAGRAEVRDLLKEANRKRTALLNAWDLAEVHDRAERYEQARRSWLRVLSLDPNHKRARAALAAQPELLRRRELNRSIQTVLDKVEHRMWHESKLAFDALLELANEDDAARIAPVEEAFRRFEKRLERTRANFEAAWADGDTRALEQGLDELEGWGEDPEALELARRQVKYTAARRKLRVALKAREIQGAREELERLVALAGPESQDELIGLRVEVNELRDELLAEIAVSFERHLGERELDSAERLRLRYEEVGGDPATLSGLERLFVLNERAKLRRLWRRRGARWMGTGALLVAAYLAIAVVWNRDCDEEAWAHLRAGDLTACAKEVERALPLPPLPPFGDFRLDHESAVSRRRVLLRGFDELYGNESWREQEALATEVGASEEAIFALLVEAVRDDLAASLSKGDLAGASDALEPLRKSEREPRGWDVESTRTRLIGLRSLSEELEPAPLALREAFSREVRQLGETRAPVPEAETLYPELVQVALAAGRAALAGDDAESGASPTPWVEALEVLENPAAAETLLGEFKGNQRKKRFDGLARTLRGGGFDVLRELTECLDESEHPTTSGRFLSDLELFQGELVSPDGLGRLGVDRLMQLEDLVHEPLPELLAQAFGAANLAQSIASLDQRLQVEVERRLGEMFSGESYRVGASRHLRAELAFPNANITIDGVPLRRLEWGLYEVPTEVPEGSSRRTLVLEAPYGRRVERQALLEIDTTAPSFDLSVLPVEVLEGEPWLIEVPRGGEQLSYELEPAREIERVEPGGPGEPTRLRIRGVGEIPPGQEQLEVQASLVAIDDFGNRSAPLLLEMRSISRRFHEARELVNKGSGREAWSLALERLTPDLQAASCSPAILKLARSAAAIGLRGSVAIQNAGLHQHGLERETDSVKAQLRLEEYLSLLARTKQRLVSILGSERAAALPARAQDASAAGTTALWDATRFDRGADGSWNFELYEALASLALRATQLSAEGERLHTILVDYNAEGCLGALDATALADSLRGMDRVAAPSAMTLWVRAAQNVLERARASQVEELVVPRVHDWRLWGSGEGILPNMIRLPGTKGIDFVFVPASAEGDRGFFLGRTEVSMQAWWRHGGRQLDSDSLLDPASGMSWVEADEWCKRAKLRLPTATEWVAAGTRPEWSSSFNQEGCTRVEGLSGPYEAGRGVAGQPSDRSWCGVLDLAGNVKEWTAERYSEGGKPVEGERVLCGGSWQDAPDARRIAHSGHANEKKVGDTTIGFRPVLDL